MSRDLVSLYKEMAERGGSFFGLSILQHRDIIRELVVTTRSTRLLDFGCGRGDAYAEPHCMHQYWHLDPPALYDPAFPQHDKLPAGTFHGVLCSDVLEHVPEEDIDAFVKQLFALAEVFVWASVCCRPAKKSFDDGTNMHVTLQPINWWNEKFQRFSDGKLFELTETF